MLTTLCWTWILNADHQTAGLLSFGVLAPLHYAASKLSLLKTTEGFVNAGTESFVFTGRTDYIHSHPLEDWSADLLIIDLRVAMRWLVLLFLLEPFELVRKVQNGTDQRQHSLIVAARF